MIDPQTKHATETPPLRCDAFERSLLPVIRHFLTTLDGSEPKGWHRAYSIAAENWSETLGLSVAHHLQKLLHAVTDCRPDDIDYRDPLCPEARLTVTEDEQFLIEMLHHMRRDQTAQARVCVDYLTRGRMDPDVIRGGLRFASRFSLGETGPRKTVTRPTLTLVK